VLEVVEQRFQGSKVAAKLAIESTVGRAVDEGIGQLLMPNINIPHKGEGRSKTPGGCGVPSLQQLIGDFGQRTHHQHGMSAQSASHNADQPPDRPHILDRSAAKLHYDSFVALFKPALPLLSAHSPNSLSGSFCRREKPTARLLLAVGSVNLLKIALLHPIPSSRRHFVIRVDMPVPVDVIRVSLWSEMVMIAI
jgi:hypothetical protein